MKYYFFYGGIRCSSPAARLMASRLTNIKLPTIHLTNQPQHRPFWYSSQTIAEDFWVEEAAKTINYGPVLAIFVESVAQPTKSRKTRGHNPQKQRYRHLIFQ